MLKTAGTNGRRRSHFEAIVYKLFKLFILKSAFEYFFFYIFNTINTRVKIVFQKAEKSTFHQRKLCRLKEISSYL
jgi:hypothetical protein